MKTFFLLALFATTAFAQDYNLEKGKATYTVKHLIKTVDGTSDEVKGKVKCKDGQCEFLVAVRIESFQSSDSNRDLNMYTTLESKKYPVTTAKGTFSQVEWEKPKATIKAEIDFHGVKKTYDVTLTSKNKVDLTLDLDAHKVERPSLFTAKIENSVPVHFDLTWKKTE